MEKLSTVFFYRLEKTIKVYRQYAQSQLKENGLDITVDQWLILKALSDNPEANQNELAETVFKDKASVTRIIDILVISGWLEREADEENRRRSRLTITRKGKNLMEKVTPVVQKYRRTALKDIPEADLQKAEKVLNAITANCLK
jgi:MarR family transcriptional regulator for hemolysin